MSDLKNALSRVVVPINKEGYFTIIIALFITIIAMSIWHVLGYLSLIITFFIIYFFRDPERVIPDDTNCIVASADGVVDKIEEVQAPKELSLGNKKFQRVSIFLNTFNVHVQRIPITGKIERVIYVPGKFLNITNDKYHEDNERQICLLKTNNDLEIPFVQIAGMVAKRIVCYLKEGQEVSTGERFGCIKFGSRVDVYLPTNVKVKIKVGQTMIAGETVIASLN